jgi:precorrin-3B synthase
MTPPIIKGWCPGALRPMMSGDGLVVRLRPFGGRLTQAQARGVAELARQHGNGLIDLSARANLQLRGVTEASHPALIAGLTDLGLVDDNPQAEARRNIILTPFWTTGDLSHVLAADLARALNTATLPLPGKFGFAVDCGPAPVLRDISADIRLEASGDGRVILRADGADLGVAVPPAEAIAQAVALADWFLASGGAVAGRGRMARHLAHTALPPRFATDKALPHSPNPTLPGPCPQGFLTGFAFGQMQAQTLAALADLGALRLTPWRMLLIEDQAEAPQLPDLITQADDALLRVVACTGAPACPQALAATRDLARALASSVPQGTLLHVSGCAKGCAHPGPADVTLVAVGQGYAALHNLTAADTPPFDPLPHPLTAESLIAAPGQLFENPYAA